jgi:lipoprotein NlpI
MRTALAVLFLGLALSIISAARAGEEKDFLSQARAALRSGKLEDALALLNKAIAAAPKDGEALTLRAAAHEALDRYADAVTDLTKVIELDPKRADAYQRRGGVYFKLGKIDESIADFDRYLKLRPDQLPSHWQRGISYYYARRYEDGQKQFEGYQTYDSNDVENGVWRYLCMARAVGKEKARAAMLKIGPDRRVPMREIYELFAGKATPDDVLAAVKRGDPEGDELRKRTFYARLYLGLYFYSEGDRAKALRHLETAVENRVGHYMWDVARVHRDLLRKQRKGE